MFFIKKAFSNNIYILPKKTEFNNIKNFLSVNKFNFSAQAQSATPKKDASQQTSTIINNHYKIYRTRSTTSHTNISRIQII
jgi:hypothetical protein